MTMITDNAERRYLEALGPRLPRPDAILAVSAHWETQGRTHITDGDLPRTIHDFRGFPQALFDMRYPAPNAPALQARIEELAGPERIVRDAGWGYDHGTWGVLSMLYPAADIPVVAMSLDRSLDAEQHIALARTLAPLRREGVMIVASGNVVHNLALWRSLAGTLPEWAEAFRHRINKAVIDNDERALTHFAADDEAAKAAINSAEHYLPLLYAVGVRLPEDKVAVFNDTVDGALSMTSYLIGNSGLLPQIP